MHPEKVWIVIILLIVILVFSNLAMFVLVRSWSPRKDKTSLSEQFRDFTKPWKAQDDQLKELNERVKGLNTDEEKEK